MAAPDPLLQALITGATHLQAAKYFQVASFVVLVYDHFITFSEEVERIWKGRVSGASILFLLNRYCTPIQFIIIIDAFNDPAWTMPVCQRFVRFEGATTVALIAVCEMIMILRVYALYDRNIWILGFLLTLWVAQIIMASLGIASGYALQLPPGFIGCILTGHSLIAAVWVAPLVTNSIMFLLTVYRSRELVFMNRRSAPILHIFVRDGTLYFFVIFAANLMNTIIYFTAVPDLKAIGASFSQLITATMISRLVLNLRSASSSDYHGGTTLTNAGAYPQKGAAAKFMDRAVGQLGEMVETRFEAERRTYHTEDYPYSTFGGPEEYDLDEVGLNHSRTVVNTRSE